jgi:Co/Zn/Cd efflux system component/copper chaperone CopZ
MNRSSKSDSDALLYRISGMDCASCAEEIKTAVSAIDGVNEVRVSTASQIMTLRVNDARVKLADVEKKVTDIGYGLQRLDAGKDDEDLPADFSHITPAYKRALWTVVLLNTGYGLVEMVAGFISRSQALKADALDFLGDGLITFLGLLAVRWSVVWRARSALIQGVFLAGLGIGVLATTAYRLLVQVPPEADVMGLYGGIALVVNVAAALVLIPHRTGDANVRAVWLFSRNDAIGNVAVVLAAGLVAWTGSAWPDLVVAIVIALLFLQSSWSIIRDARADLQESHGTA